MKIKLLSATLLLTFFSVGQTTVYEEDFEGSLTPFFQLNTDHLGGQENGSTEWVVNNVYFGGPVDIQNIQLPFPETVNIPDIPNQPAGITKSPNSTYLHMLQGNASAQGFMNSSYIWTGDPSNVSVAGMGDTYFARTQGVNAIDMTDVILSFWWLGGMTPSKGEVYCFFDKGNNWTLLLTDLTDQADWTQETISIPEWDNLSTGIWFGFRAVIADEFQAGGGFLDAASGFSIDDIKVTGIVNTNSLTEMNNKSISIYPNPATTAVTINSEENIESIQIFDLNGTLVQQEKTTKFSIESLSTGIYMMNITTQNGVKRARLIKE